MPYPFPVGKIRADELNGALAAGTVVARGQRTSNSTAAATEQGVLRIDGIAVTSGNVYYVTTNAVLVDTSVNNDVGGLRLRVDTTGAAATTASTQIAQASTRMTDAATADSATIGATRVAGAGETWSILLSTFRVAGTGNIGLVATATIPIEVLVVNLGEDPGDTGVDI